VFGNILKYIRMGASSNLIICAVGVWLPYSPFAQALGFTPLPALY
jgi:hypothetical protein